jgi:EmrB/QacA subfamily drug resistance transporter
MQSSQTSRHPGMTLFVVVAMSFLATLDSSIVNIALPVISHSLQSPLSSIEWIIASYVMIICSTLLFFGRLGDIAGKSVVFRYGMLLFLAGSLLCGMCQSLLSLIVCRFIQGLGAAAYMANNQGIITQLYPREGRGRALGILGASVALGTMTGAPLGGVIVSLLGWNYIFFVTVPIGAVVFILGLFFLPADTVDQTRAKQRIDIPGAVLQFCGTTALFGVLISAQQSGFMHPVILTVLAAALVMLVIFFVYESRCEQPLLDLSLFSNALYSISLLCAFISFMCIAAYTIILPFYLQNALHLTPSLSGLIMMTAPLIIACLSPAMGALSDRTGAEVLTVCGLIVMAAAFSAFSFLNEASAPVLCAIVLAIMAVGQALFQPTNNSLIMSACPKTKLGIGGSVNSLIRNFGQYSGIVFSTTLLYAFMSSKTGYQVHDYVNGHDDVFVYGMKRVCLILTACCCAGAVITVFRAKKMRTGKSAAV